MGRAISELVKQRGEGSLVEGERRRELAVVDQDGRQWSIIGEDYLWEAEEQT